MVSPSPASAVGPLKHTSALFKVTFGFGASEELQKEAMMVLALVVVVEAEAVKVVGSEERVARLGNVLAAANPVEAKVNGP